MKFIISSGELLKHLQVLGKVITSKGTLPILDNFLFKVSDMNLKITSSDIETTLSANVDLISCEGEGEIAIEAKRLSDIIKEFPEQPLTFEIDLESYKVDLYSDKGIYTIIGLPTDQYPSEPVLQEENFITEVQAEIFQSGISKTIFATSDDEMRPIMNGIYVEFNSEFMSFVASDSHKLVRYRRHEKGFDFESSFILPKKSASLLKSILLKVENEMKIEFDSTNIFFTTSNYKITCRRIEGNYPNYNSVIPTSNPFKFTADRIEFINTLKRVNVFASQSSNLIIMHLMQNDSKVSGQDIDYNSSAIESLPCSYDGENLEIGFKSLFLIELLNNISSPDVLMEFVDSSRAGRILPTENDNEHEEILMILMPMMINVN